MHKRWIIAVLLCAAAPMTGCNPESGIPVIGMDKNGNPGQVWIGGEDYTSRLGAVLTSVNDSVLPVVNAQSASKSWMLRTVTVGVGVTTEVGIGPWKVGAVPRARLIFSNSSDPTLP